MNPFLVPVNIHIYQQLELLNIYKKHIFFLMKWLHLENNITTGHASRFYCTYLVLLTNLFQSFFLHQAKPDSASPASASWCAHNSPAGKPQKEDMNSCTVRLFYMTRWYFQGCYHMSAPVNAKFQNKSWLCTAVQYRIDTVPKTTAMRNRNAIDSSLFFV